MALEPKPYPPDSEMNPYYIGVGRVCMAWATFETRVNHAIWQLSNVEQYIGACITAQFNAPAPRLLALVSLLEQRKASKEAIDEINSLTAAARGIAGDRNRIAHDPAYMKDGQYHRLQITADRKLVFQMQPNALDEIRAVEKKIRGLIHRFDDWHAKTFAALPPYPDAQFRQSPGFEIYPLPQQDL